MSESISCFCCGSTESKLIKTSGQFNIPLNLVVCKECGFTFLNPRKSKEEYMSFYANDYDKYYRPSIKAIKKGADSNKLGDVITNRIVDQLPPCENILEIGSGSGFNLISLMNHFPKANYYAIEPSNTSKEILERSNIKVISSDVDSDWESSETKYDLIIMRHVLEHMMDPISVLKKIASSLSDKGMFYVAVPNSYKPKSPFKSWVRFPHTFYFSKDSLAVILKKSGLEIVNELKEGDEINPFELFGLAKKGELETITEVTNHFDKQIAVFDTIINKEKQIPYRIKQTLLQLKSKFTS